MQVLFMVFPGWERKNLDFVDLVKLQATKIVTQSVATDQHNKNPIIASYGPHETHTG